MSAAFLQRLVVAGVWGPLCFLALLFASLHFIGLMQPIPVRLLGLPYVAFSLGLVSVHVFVLLGILGVVLVVSGRAPRPRLTLLSALVGLLVGVPALASLYMPLLRH